MRTTLILNDALLQAAKQQAAQERTTLTQLLDRALRQYLDTASRPAAEFRFEPVVKSGRAARGVDWDDRDSLYERMEEQD